MFYLGHSNAHVRECERVCAGNVVITDIRNIDWHLRILHTLTL